MIPKIIHFCWFGSAEYPQLVKKCINTWKKVLPDYEIMLWNEDNFAIDDYCFAKEALKSKKYAFVADVCRLVALRDFGGIYMDTDVEIIQSLDKFLHHKAFIGFENNDVLCTAIIGSERSGVWVKEMLEYYKNRSFYTSDGKYDTTTNVEIISNIMQGKGYVLDNDYRDYNNYITLYPSKVFSPKSHLDGKIRMSDNTVAIHHFAGSWFSKTERRNKKIKVFLRNIIGNKNFERIKLLKKKG